MDVLIGLRRQRLPLLRGSTLMLRIKLGCATWKGWSGDHR